MFPKTLITLHLNTIFIVRSDLSVGVVSSPARYTVTDAEEEYNEAEDVDEAYDEDDDDEGDSEDNAKEPPDVEYVRHVTVSTGKYGSSTGNTQSNPTGQHSNGNTRSRFVTRFSANTVNGQESENVKGKQNSSYKSKNKPSSYTKEVNHFNVDTRDERKLNNKNAQNSHFKSVYLSNNDRKQPTVKPTFKHIPTPFTKQPDRSYQGTTNYVTNAQTFNTPPTTTFADFKLPNSNRNKEIFRNKNKSYQNPVWFKTKSTFPTSIKSTSLAGISSQAQSHKSTYFGENSAYAQSFRTAVKRVDAPPPMSTRPQYPTYDPVMFVSQKTGIDTSTAATKASGFAGQETIYSNDHPKGTVTNGLSNIAPVELSLKASDYANENDKIHRNSAYGQGFSTVVKRVETQPRIPVESKSRFGGQEAIYSNDPAKTVLNGLGNNMPVKLSLNPVDYASGINRKETSQMSRPTKSKRTQDAEFKIDSPLEMYKAWVSPKVISAKPFTAGSENNKADAMSPIPFSKIQPSSKVSNTYTASALSTAVNHVGGQETIYSTDTSEGIVRNDLGKHAPVKLSLNAADYTPEKTSSNNVAGKVETRNPTSEYSGNNWYYIGDQSLLNRLPNTEHFSTLPALTENTKLATMTDTSSMTNNKLPVTKNQGVHTVQVITGSQIRSRERKLKQPQYHSGLSEIMVPTVQAIRIQEPKEQNTKSEYSIKIACNYI